MISKKKLLMHHPWPAEAIPGGGLDPEGFRWLLNIWTLYIKCRFFLHCQVKSLEALLLRLGCLFFSTWHYIKHNSICTNGYILKVNNIYTFKECNYIDIVRLLDVLETQIICILLCIFSAKTKLLL